MGTNPFKIGETVELKFCHHTPLSITAFVFNGNLTTSVSDFVQVTNQVEPFHQITVHHSLLQKYVPRPKEMVM